MDKSDVFSFGLFLLIAADPGSIHIVSISLSFFPFSRVPGCIFSGWTRRALVFCTFSAIPDYIMANDHG